MKYTFYLFVLTVTAFSCIRTPECNDIRSYAFEIPATLSPSNRTFNIGDTITLNSTFSDVVYDRTNDKDYLLQDFLFYPSAIFQRIDTSGLDTLEIVTQDHFDFIIEPRFDIETIDYTTGRALIGQYNYEEDKYSLEFKFVLKKKGIYFMMFNSDIYFFGKDQEFPGKCDLVFTDDLITILNDGAANNADLLLEAADPGWHLVYNEKLERSFLNLGGYCFKVE